MRNFRDIVVSESFAGTFGHVLKERAIAEASERLSGESLTELTVGGPGVSPAKRARTRTRTIDVDHLELVVVAESDALSSSPDGAVFRPVSSARRGRKARRLSRRSAGEPSLVCRVGGELGDAVVGRSLTSERDPLFTAKQRSNIVDIPSKRFARVSTDTGRSASTWPWRRNP